MSGKYALVIGNTEYTDPGLAQLTAPGRDAEDLAHILKDQEIGAFDDVNILLNQPSAVVSEAIDEFFSQKKPDDLLILFFSGHGVRDELGALYLAVKNTIRSRLRSTAIKSDFIRDAMDQSRSKRQVLILDCCNSGAFAHGTKAAIGTSIGIASAFDAGYGRVILTATDSTQFAWEGDKVIGETSNSLFTHYLVKGLKGEADQDGDGRITVDELYDYAYEQVRLVTPKQTPSKFSTKQQGEIVLRESTRLEDIRSVPLPAPLLDSIANPFSDIRLGAVQQLAKLLNGRNLGLARSAGEALERMAKEDDSRQVQVAASRVLNEINRVEVEQSLSRQKDGDAEPTKTAKLRREKVEQAILFRMEQDRLLKEKAELERKLVEAASTTKKPKAKKEPSGQSVDLAKPFLGLNRKLAFGIAGAFMTILIISLGSLARNLITGPGVPTQTPTFALTFTLLPSATSTHTMTFTVSPSPTETFTIVPSLTNTSVPLPTIQPTKKEKRPTPTPGLCLSIHSQIDTPQGPVAVENLHIGDLVWTVDASGARVSVVILKVKKTFVPASHIVMHLVLNDGRELLASPGHPTADGRTLGTLQPGDLLDGARITQVDQVVYGQPATYDILPDGATGFYWADGILLGSTLNSR